MPCWPFRSDTRLKCSMRCKPDHECPIADNEGVVLSLERASGSSISGRGTHCHRVQLEVLVEAQLELRVCFECLSADRLRSSVPCSWKGRQVPRSQAEAPTVTVSSWKSWSKRSLSCESVLSVSVPIV